MPPWTWFCGIRCMAHVGSNGVKWGIARLTTEQHMEDLHVGIRSLRQTSVQLRKHIRSFLVKHMTYDEEKAIPWEARRMYWEALCLDVNTLELFEEINPRWDPLTSSLTVNVALQDDPDGFEKSGGSHDIRLQLD